MAADEPDLYEQADEASTTLENALFWSFFTGGAALVILVSALESTVVSVLTEWGRAVFLGGGLLALVMAFMCGAAGLKAMQANQEHNEAKEKLEHKLGVCCCGD